MTTVYVNVWKPVEVTHACSGNGMTMCGIPIPQTWEEGGTFEADESETYVTCKKCLKAIASNQE